MKNLWIALSFVTFFQTTSLLADAPPTQWHDDVLNLDFQYVGVMQYETLRSRPAQQACRNLGPRWVLPNENIMLQGQPVGNALVSRLFASEGFSENLYVNQGPALAGQSMWLEKPVRNCVSFYRAQGSQIIQKRYYQTICSRTLLPVVCVRLPF